MSLLEDVFLQDEAGEAHDLERIIEGDEYDERRLESDDDDDGGPKDDEAEEDKRRIDPTSDKAKRVVKNPRFTLNPARLTGPRGIQVIPEHFKDFKFKGKGHEREDLDMVLKTLEHWAYRLYPKFKFQDCLKKIEILGKKRPVAVHLHKIRSDQFLEDPVVQEDTSDDEPTGTTERPVDEFDVMLQEQINNSTIQTPMAKKHGLDLDHLDLRSPMLMPKATSSPSISAEQKERMLRNRKLAEERRRARLAGTQAIGNDKNGQIEPRESVENHDVNSSRSKKSNIITSDSSDEEVSIIHTTMVEVHNKSTKDMEEDLDENSGNKDMDTGIEEIHHDKDLGSATDNIEIDRRIEDISSKDKGQVPSKEDDRQKKSNIISDSSDEEVSVINTTMVEVHNKSTKDMEKGIDENSENKDMDIGIEEDNEPCKDENDVEQIAKSIIKEKDSNKIEIEEETNFNNIFEKLIQETNDQNQIANKENLSSDDIEMTEI